MSYMRCNSEEVFQLAKKDRGQVKRGPTQNNQNTSKKDSRLKDRSGPNKNKK